MDQKAARRPLRGFSAQRSIMSGMANARRVTLSIDPVIWDFLEKRLLVVDNALSAERGKPRVSMGQLIAALVTKVAIENRDEIIREYEKVMSRVSHIEFGATVSPSAVAELGAVLPKGDRRIATRKAKSTGARASSGAFPLGRVLPSGRGHAPKKRRRNRSDDS